MIVGRMLRPRVAASLVVVLLLTRCSAAPMRDPAHPASTSGWIETRLYFGLGPADRPAAGVGESGWRDFLDHEVTPRFPDGLSVLDVYGQWQGPGAVAPERLRSKLLVIDCPDTAASRTRIEAIRRAWRRRTGDRSVLRVTEKAEVSF